MNNTSKGLTLIEMLVVIAILSVVAGMVVSLTGNMDMSNRQQVSARRLLEIRSAILGPDAVSYSGDLLSGGYLQDTGWLPDKAADLLTQPTIAPGVLMPALSYSPVWRTWAGWRGPYLSAPPKRNGDTSATLYDDWGTEFYGWFTESTTTPSWALVRLSGNYSLRSMGADGKKDSDGGKTGVYEQDYPLVDQPLIVESDWVTDLTVYDPVTRLPVVNPDLSVKTGLTVNVVNCTANDYSSSPLQVRFRIIVPRWDLSDPLGYAGSLDSNCFVSTGFPLGVSPAGTVNGAYQCVCAFNCNPGNTLRIPNGRRMLFLVGATDGQPLSGVQAYAELRLSKHLSPPGCVTLEIRNGN